MPDETQDQKTASTTTNVSVAVATTSPVDETLLQKIGDDLSAAGHAIGSVFVKAETKAETLLKAFSTEELPVIENLLETLGSQVGKAALGAAMASVPLLASGGWAAAAASVGTAVAATATADAPVDVQQALQATQLALQAVKVSSDTVVAGDQPTIAVITAASTAAQ